MTRYVVRSPLPIDLQNFLGLIVSPSQERHELEEELHIELLPGTEVMADIGSHHFIKSTGKAHKVLVPQPSDNEHDPLNWSLGWKISAIVSASFVTFMQGFGPLSLAPMFGDYIEAFHCSLADAVQFTGVAILVLGFSNFIWYVTPHSVDFLFANALRTGFLSALPLVAVRFISCLSSSASAPPYGERELRHMGVSWVLACKS